MKTYVVDIDNTICTQEKDYNKARPLLKRIIKLNELYLKGHDIIYFTARGSETGIDWEEVTLQQFKKWHVLYTKLLFGKPAGDVYIDDKAISDKILDII